MKRVGKEREVGFLRLTECEEGRGKRKMGERFQFRLSWRELGEREIWLTLHYYIDHRHLPSVSD